MIKFGENLSEIRSYITKEKFWENGNEGIFVDLLSFW